MCDNVLKHWRQVLGPETILEVSYEKLVSDPEPMVRELYNYCGLSYHEDWSSFWHRSGRVDTASRWQVRRPIYRSSVQKWVNYKAFLGPLLELDPDRSSGNLEVISAHSPASE